VEEFLRAALHDPRRGYYRTRGRPPGRTGDFSTAAGLHPVLGRTVAAWIRAQGGAAPRAVIELGGGDGSLLDTVLRTLGWVGRRRRRFHLVDASGPMREAQRARLRWHRGLQWHETIEEALAAAGGEALIFSNEFADAFPCAVLESTPEGWRELEVAQQPDGTITESLGAIRSDIRGIPSSALAYGGTATRTGTRIEVHAAYAEWLHRWVAGWRRGALLTIDYGAPFPEVYDRRPRGTLRGYFHHTVASGREVYQNAGHQDLTADVNFTDLVHWGEAVGLRATRLETLAGFVASTAPHLLRGADPIRDRLLDPHGAGVAFRVLEQVRDPVNPASPPPPQARDPQGF